MKNWIIVFANGDRYNVQGDMKDAFAVCYERNEIPVRVSGKKIEKS